MHGRTVEHTRVRTLSPIHYVQKMHSLACQSLFQMSWQHHLPHTLSVWLSTIKSVTACQYCKSLSQNWCNFH